jgi:dihydroorotase
MHSNYAFYFGATPENVDQLSQLKNLKGCCGIKLFAGSSTGNLLVDKEADIEKVISNADRVVSIHSEDEEILNLRKKFIKKGDVHSHPEWRNSETAMSSTRRVVKIAERYNKKIHVLHVTTKEEVDFLAMHKKNVTFETTPQHLTLYAPDCYDKLGTYAQMNPPLRTKDHYDRLWTAIKNNVVDVLGSDHAPHTKKNKQKEYPNSPSGMPGVQTIFPVMLDHVNNNKLTLEQLIKLMCENPCKIFGIKDKGFIKENYDADLTIVDMKKRTSN